MVPNKIVKKFVLGSAQFGDKYGINNPYASKSKKNSFKILKYARFSGINTIDLADKYKSYKDIFSNFKLKNWKVSMKISDKIVNRYSTKHKFENFFFKTLIHLHKKKNRIYFFSQFFRFKKEKWKKNI